MLLEVIVENAEEAIEAENLGADRLELISAMSEGGLTPSYGTIKNVLASVSIPVCIMVRPHSYYYDYTAGDIEIIREDIRKILYLGGTQVVFGALNKDKTINQQVLEEVIQISPRLEITFHRAFDETPSQTQAYLLLAEYKESVKQILTSGGQDTWKEGIDELQALVSLSRRLDGPKIMPGSSLNLDNIQDIHAKVKADQYHFGKAVRMDQTFSKGFDAATMNKLSMFLKNN